jgi:hypothetical protein
MKYALNFYTQYHQFYLSDELSPGKTNSKSFWTKDAYNDRLAMEDGIVGIGTECYGPVKGELEILENENTNFDSTTYDHIVEGALEMTSNTLIVTDCPNPGAILKINIKPGKYRVRVYSSNLDSVEGDDGDDYYRIEVWPSSNMERKVLTRFVNN